MLHNNEYELGHRFHGDISGGSGELSFDDMF
jgi:hypothetical protein